MIIIILILTTTIIIMIIIIAIMIMMIKIILIIVVIIIINSQFYPFDFSTGSTTAVNIYLFKVTTNRNIRKRYEICSKLTINAPERHQQLRSGVFIVNFEHILLFFLVFLLLTLNK